jgi:UPF0755 protein
VTVTIPEGTTTAGVASILGHAGVIHSPRVFTWYVRLHGAGPFEAGGYVLHRNSSYAAAIRALRAGPAFAIDRIAVPEGFTVEQIAARVGKLPGRSAERFLAAARVGVVRSRYQPPGSENLEGVLYPATYGLKRGDDEIAILRRMVAAFDRTGAELGIDQGAARLGLSPYQVVIVASMVEREAKLDEDRGPIASVIYNRLRAGMPLGVDATLLYGLHTATLNAADLDSNSPYNTRKFRGFPPTPIASPGRASLLAAISPPTTPFLYYVLIDADGKTAFARNAADFERLKDEARAKGLLGS